MSANPERLPAPTHSQLVPFSDIEKMSKAISPQLFGLKSAQEVCTLMLLGQADGIHPITALRRYHIIGGKPSMKADAMLADYLENGGKVKWLKRTDECVEAEFTVKDSTVKIKWDKERVQKAQLGGNHQKYPQQMLTARVISEGVRLMMPQIVTGMYTPEEVTDFTGATPATPEPEALTPAQIRAWVFNVLDSTSFSRTQETQDYTFFRDQLAGKIQHLAEEDQLVLREGTFASWIKCMILTATPEETQSNKWGKFIDTYKNRMSQHTVTVLQSFLKPADKPHDPGIPRHTELPEDTPAEQPQPTPTGPEWVQTWLNRIKAANKQGPAISIIDQLIEDYNSAPEPDQVEHFPGLFMAWVEHCLGLKLKAQVEKRLTGKIDLPIKILDPLFSRLKQ